VHDQPPVCVLHRVAHLAEECEPRPQVQAQAVAVQVDRLALDVFHHEEGRAVGRHPGIEEAGDAGVVQPRQDLPLGEEATPEQVGVEAGRKHLDRDAHLHLAAGALRQVDRPHPPLADAADEPVGPYLPLPGPGVHPGRRGAEGQGRGHRARPLRQFRQPPLGTLRGFQQRRDLVVQRPVAAARLLEKTGALIGRPRARGVEQRRDPLPSRIVHVGSSMVEERIERSADRAVDRAVDATFELAENEVACLAGDQQCVEQAERAGAEVVLVDEQGDRAVGAAATAAAATPATPGDDVWANYDFVPGDRVLFADDFANDRVGNFPRRLEFVSGNLEIVEWQGSPYLRSSARSVFQVHLPEALPERFTIEFDMHNGRAVRGTQIHTESLDRRAPRNSYFELGYRSGVSTPRGGPQARTTSTRLMEEVVPVRIMVDGSYAKVFLNEQRVANIPNAQFNRTNVLQFNFAGSERHPSYIGNLRIAAGGPSLYDALERDGRVATQGILFDTGSDRIQPESTPTLQEIGAMLTQNPDLRLRIEGHTDSVGNAASNQQLSDQRAASVRQHLIERFGIDTSRLEAVGMGQNNPVDSNDTPEGRQNNRRVELVRL
jgi:OmpA-OmpF porin, OOP family